MSTYQPPAYGSSQPKATDPLLAAGGNHQPSNRWEDEGEEGEAEDFKYGVTVSQSSKEVRDAFVRKVYTILFIQLVSPLYSTTFTTISRALT